MSCENLPSDWMYHWIVCSDCGVGFFQVEGHECLEEPIEEDDPTWDIWLNDTNKENNMADMKPLYEHDCAGCRYLGTSLEDGVRYDLYYCGGHECGPGNTVVCRYGNDGPEYKSGMAFADNGKEPYAEAKRRAIFSGAYNPTEQPLVAPDQATKHVVLMLDHLANALVKAQWICGDRRSQELALRELDKLMTRSSPGEAEVEAIKAFKEYLKTQIKEWKEWKEEEDQRHD